MRTYVRSSLPNAQGEEMPNQLPQGGLLLSPQAAQVDRQIMAPEKLRSYRDILAEAGFVPPSEEELRRHASRFGLEGVQEVATFYGINKTSASRPDRDVEARVARVKSGRREAIRQA